MKWLNQPLAALATLALFISPANGANVDTLKLGDAGSEQAHHLQAQKSDTIVGGLGQPARRLLPLDSVSYVGGTVWFDLKIDPDKQNYFTVKLWGSDKGASRLMLFSEGLQIGYRWGGDYDVLNQMDEEGEFPGRFFYQTLPLPPKLTKGKKNISLQIASLGPVWGYGTNFTQYQKSLTEPTRGIYQVYSHTETRFVPDGSEKQGSLSTPAVRKSPGEEVIGQSKNIVVARLSKLLSTPLSSEKSADQKARAAQLLLASDAFNVSWTPAFHNQRAIDQIVHDGDAMANDFANDPKYAGKDWPGAGPLGEAIMRTWPATEKALDKPIGNLTRRKAWSSALRTSVDFWRTHRRDYTNQSMIVDRNIYTANRALLLIDPSRALPEEKVKHFLYQAVGIEPWLRSDVPDDASSSTVADASSAGVNKPFGEHYCLITKKGLSRELGYVGTYGETILHFTHDIAQLTGDEKIRQQLAKLESARMYFRYPGVDGDGYRCMKLASEVDNRTAHYPLAGSAYTAPNIREEWWMDIPALLSDDPVAVGAAQQALADNQYFNYVKSRLAESETQGMMRNVDEYEKVKTLPPSTFRLPMTDGRPDFVFSDEEDAMLAIKHGDDRLFINLYYRAERGVNGVARLQEITPTIDRIATVRTEFEVQPTGHTYTRPDWMDGIRSKGFPPPGEIIHEAWAGEKLPIAPRPADAIVPKYGDWGPFLGKAAFYRLRYGNYLIAVNTTQTETYTLKVDSDMAHATDLVTNQVIAGEGALKVLPLSTVVLYSTN